MGFLDELKRLTHPYEDEMEDDYDEDEDVYEDEEEPEPVRGDTEDGTASMALVIAQTERDTYKRMYESLLARMTMEREETA